jgi:hypothetical protein
MAAVSQCRALAGAKAMSFREVRSCRPVRVENGAKWTMRRRDSYMVEVRGDLHGPQLQHGRAGPGGAGGDAGAGQGVHRE